MEMIINSNFFLQCFDTKGIQLTLLTPVLKENRFTVVPLKIGR